MNQNTKVILVGGFLGAGKTTLLLKASQHLANRGKKAGLITNDQAPELVDSTLLASSGLQVAEVSGSCFCCNFNGFIDAVQKYGIDRSVDYIIAEPVGSCTDLSATIMQPLKQYWSDRFAIAPLSVLADAGRLSAILEDSNDGLHPDAAYIFRKQLEEADIIVINKIDLLTPEQRIDLDNRTAQDYPGATVMMVSALTGEGIDAWLDGVIRRNDAGKRLAEVDYDIYAHGEAVLGWLNGTVELQGKSTDWDQLLGALMNDLCARFERENLPVGHVKAIVENGGNVAVANFTGGAKTLSVRGSAGTGDVCRLTVNARVETTPENLDGIVRAALNAHTAGLACNELAWKYFQPGRPNPTYRFDNVI
jgi:Ni2+-binding GTPase involved in maturation of urease and hydrogenase